MAFFGLFRSRRHERAGYALYTEAVQAARDPAFYTRFGVPDTLDVPSSPALLCEIYGVRRRKLSDAIPSSTTQNAKSTTASIAILPSGNACSSAAPPKDCIVSTA